MAALTGLAVLLPCQSAGAVLVRLTHAPLPGPVPGLLLLPATGTPCPTCFPGAQPCAPC